MGAAALGPAVVTAEFKINYLRPALGDAIIVRAQVVYAGKTQAICRCDLFVSRADRETLCTVAQGTITRLSQPPV